MKKNVIIIGLGLFLCTIVFAQPQQKQIIAVAALEKTENSQICNKAAHAPYYLIFDKAGNLIEVISNPFCDTARGAGPKVANFLASKNVYIVVAGNFGHKMKSTLDKKGIDCHKVSGIVKNVVEDLIR